MNIGMSCPLTLCTLIENFRIYLYIVSLVVILSNWVCDNWVYQFPIKVVLEMGVCQWSEMGLKVGEKWVSGAKVGEKWVFVSENGSKPTSSPPLDFFGTLTTTHV